MAFTAFIRRGKGVCGRNRKNPENKKISVHHTFVSGEVSKKAHHGKKGIHFKENYLPNVDMAIQRAKCFANSEEELVRDIGCNLWQLFEKMKSGC